MAFQCTRSAHESSGKLLRTSSRRIPYCHPKSFVKRPFTWLPLSFRFPPNADTSPHMSGTVQAFPVAFSLPLFAQFQCLYSDGNASKALNRHTVCTVFRLSHHKLYKPLCGHPAKRHLGLDSFSLSCRNCRIAHTEVPQSHDTSRTDREIALLNEQTFPDQAHPIDQERRKPVQMGGGKALHAPDHIDGDKREIAPNVPSTSIYANTAFALCIRCTAP